MKVLSVASEAVPLIKTGGLADVVGALPQPLAKHGIDMRPFLPGYPAVVAGTGKGKRVHFYPSLFGGPASIVSAEVDDYRLFYLDAPHLFDRAGGPYAMQAGGDWSDNWRRFAALAAVGADFAAGQVDEWRPDIVHAHDWQAAMTPAYIRYRGIAGVPSVLTVHNLAFQGHFPREIFPELGLPPEAMALDGIEYYGGIGFLKAGLQSAWKITTVSPTYAQEIRTEAFGMGLEGLINARADDLVGIRNGVDVASWNPAQDAHLSSCFSPKSLKGREANKRAVENRFGLVEEDGPLICVISRLTWQKGMDLFAARFDDLVEAGARVAVLGSGDQALEGALLAAAARHRGRASVIVGYDEPLSHLMQGGCDAIVVPSRFEPCGLTQLYGLRYGCVPLVARTGGLADTVIDANEAALDAGVATGLLFEPDNADALADAVRRMIRLYADRALWSGIQKRAMRSDVSWDRSAASYAALYRSLLSRV